MTYQEARIDFERLSRLGMIEAVWGEHKTSDQIVAILRSFKAEGQAALVTRVDRNKADIVLEAIDFSGVQFHSEARCLTLGSPYEKNSTFGEVIVLSGGTSDLPVAAEAGLALRWHGIKTELILDVGVAYLQRLLSQLERLKAAKVLIACAGMEGSLPTVLAGLVAQPVIGVPISVGYGVSAGGRAALEGMLSSCSPGLVVVNIDNGYGAAMAALRILQLE
ncbi:nickel pincer cofactor biosynthesis protein LarB [Prochlorococcus sp. MIT 1341]|uniref:nickel pincer cofactor biosynthesis protein LarB n=1 Tax=Prochlorococcus sp. MIT 1341 TaxID=3096221 RepID=UPI002A74CC55|nr:nickel pincer cofactor biosynthesis protein LarB [Prochlorococcus sp. MIT 1341]